MAVWASLPPAFQGGFFPTCRLTAALTLPFGVVFYLVQAGERRRSEGRLTGIAGAVYILWPILLGIGLLGGLLGLSGYLFGR